MGAPSHQEITSGVNIIQTNRINQASLQANRVLHGDCISVMQSLPANSVDFILIDPPYLVRYQDREGRSIQNDSNSDWLVPAFKQRHRVLKQDHFLISFYGWTQVDRFFEAWRSAGFRIVGHLVFRKTYRSKSRFLKYQHEQAYLLAKGNPAKPENPIDLVTSTTDPDGTQMQYQNWAAQSLARLRHRIENLVTSRWQ